MIIWPSGGDTTLSDVCAWLLDNQVCALPTETVYGLAANGYEDAAVAQIFSLKKRPAFNPLILHYSGLEAVTRDVAFSQDAHRLAESFWPGPLTLVLPRLEGRPVSPLVSAGLSTLAVRVPAHPFLSAVLKALPFPLAAPSANPSGALTATQTLHVARAFSEIPVVDDGEGCLLGLESTVVDFSGPSPVLLRPGAIPQEALEDVLKRKLLAPSVTLDASSETSVFHSPGLLPRHYAPQKPLRLNAVTVESHEGLLAFGPPLEGAMRTLNLSHQGDMGEAAHNLFAFLHILDSSVSHIAVMPIPERGLGVAINDRLKRAIGSAERDTHD